MLAPTEPASNRPVPNTGAVPVVAATLRALLQELGPRITADAAQVRALLCDRVPEASRHRHEIDLLTVAALHGVPAQLAAVPAVPVEQVVGDLAAAAGLSPTAAHWTVTTWAYALGRPLPTVRGRRDEQRRRRGRGVLVATVAGLVVVSVLAAGGVVVAAQSRSDAPPQTEPETPEPETPEPKPEDHLRSVATELGFTGCVFDADDSDEEETASVYVTGDFLDASAAPEVIGTMSCNGGEVSNLLFLFDEGSGEDYFRDALDAVEAESSDFVSDRFANVAIASETTAFAYALENDSARVVAHMDDHPDVIAVSDWSPSVHPAVDVLDVYVATYDSAWEE
ncbi:MAG: hypothetical protein MUF83_03975 [Acidimicrobiales bacterium]|jgi:hypothetical protein|nr:hypothetical protein [Acidimicrobiales bacterium]